MKRTILHRDGTITYYSIYDQTRKSHVHHVPDEELAAMPTAERDRVIRHLDR
jgi:hypothetical protein